MSCQPWPSSEMAASGSAHVRRLPVRRLPVWCLQVWHLPFWHLPIPCLLGLAVLVDCFGFCGHWFCDLAAACAVVSGLVGGGFDGSGFWSVVFGGGRFGSWRVQAASVTSSQCCWTHQCHQDWKMQWKPNPMWAGRNGVFVCRCSYLQNQRLN